MIVLCEAYEVGFCAKHTKKDLTLFSHPNNINNNNHHHPNQIPHWLRPFLSLCIFNANFSMFVQINKKFIKIWADVLTFSKCVRDIYDKRISRILRNFKLFSLYRNKWQTNMLIYTCAEGGAYLLTYSARTPPAAHPGMMIWVVKSIFF